MKAKEAMLAQLLCDGIDVMFGNPGTVEEAILDILPDTPRMRYVMGLQEAAVSAMADAYARARKRPAFVQVHASVGLGNAMGILYQAKQTGTPLIVYAGETHADCLDYYGFLGGDTVAIAKPVTKWADRVSHPAQLLRNLRRAVKIAMTPPQGPVFLAIPMDVLDQEIEADIRPASEVDWHVSPSAEAVDRMARLLMASENPMLLAGDGVYLSDAQPQVQTLSHLIGAPVYTAGFGNMNASFKDPLMMGPTSILFADSNQRITREADLVLALGAPLFTELFPNLEPYFQPDCKLIQVDLDDWEIGKNFPTEMALHADPRLTLEAVIARIEALQDDAFRQRALTRKDALAARKTQARARLTAQFDAQRDASPMAMSRAMQVIAEHLPPQVAVFDESVTGMGAFLHYFQPSDLSGYFVARGGCLGMGLPGGIGLKLAFPDRPVAVLSGDGAAMYTFQALWTAAHENLHIVFFVLANRTYRVLKTNLLEYWRRQDVSPRTFANLDLENPVINFQELASSLGVTAYRVDSPESLQAAIVQAFSATGPQLIEIRVDGSVNPADQAAL
jgi:benzoylformate decarboxylase